MHTFFSLARLFFCLARLSSFGATVFFFVVVVFWRDFFFFFGATFFFLARLFFLWHDFFFLARLFFFICNPLRDILRARAVEQEPSNTASAAENPNDLKETSMLISLK